MKCLVTGGLGFIGSHLVDELVSLNYQVTVLDNKEEYSADTKPNCKANYINSDICNTLQCKDYFYGIDYVFHLAADSRLQPTIDNPTHCIHNNLVGLTSCLELANLNKVKRFIFSSSSSIYGNKNIEPINEQGQPDCLNPYALSKYMGELLCSHFTDLYGIETVSLRYFNVFGERSPIAGQYSPVVGIFLDQMRSNQPLTVVGNGEQRRDFVYVKDVAKANVKAALSNKYDKNNSIFNVGTGETTRIIDIAKNMSNDILYLPERKAEAYSNMANISKIKKYLNWRPTTTIIDWLKLQL